jgi:arsenate reductase
VELMKEHTSLIKRPVIENNGRIITVGFNEKEYAEKLS